MNSVVYYRRYSFAIVVVVAAIISSNYLFNLFKKAQCQKTNGRQHQRTKRKKLKELLKCSIWIFCSAKRLTDCYDYFSSSSLSSTIPSWCFAFFFLSRLVQMVLCASIRSRSSCSHYYSVTRLSASGFHARCSFVHSKPKKTLIYSYQTLSTSVLGDSGYWNLLCFSCAVNGSICMYKLTYIIYRVIGVVRQEKRENKSAKTKQNCGYDVHSCMNTLFDFRRMSNNSLCWWALTFGQTMQTFSIVVDISNSPYEWG